LSQIIQNNIQQYAVKLYIFNVVEIFLGYLLSKESVKRFVEEAIPHKQCRQDQGGAEDVEIG